MHVIDEKVPLYKWQTLDWACQITDELDNLFPDPSKPQGAMLFGFPITNPETAQSVVET